MGNIKALLVSVSQYPVLKLQALPLCINDLYAVRKALIYGLNVLPENILMCGEKEIVSIKQLIFSFEKMQILINPEDTFIFYFSGHGGDQQLALSDTGIPIQNLIDYIEKMKVKNKIIILDSCHSGDFTMEKSATLQIEQCVDTFVGVGYAVLAACRADQESGFHPSRGISLYTSFLCDALTNKFLIRKGKKSLEDISKAIYQYSSAWTRTGGHKQHPIFRSSIGGTIYFDVEEYVPYQREHIYEETEQYIIYSVEPVHHATTKRFAVKVILKYVFSWEEIADIAIQIKNRVLYCDIYQNATSEKYFKGKPANIVWCYFGYDEDDMIDPNYIGHTTWVDDTQDKEYWCKKQKNVEIINGVCCEKNSSYELVKKLMHSEEFDKNNFVKTSRAIIAKLISCGEEFIKCYREFVNKNLGEEDFVKMVKPLNSQITNLYFEYEHLPVAPKELREWTNAQTQIACSIQDFSLYYDKKNEHVWNSENRRALMDLSIKRYEEDLEVLKKIDKCINDKIDG